MNKKLLNLTVLFLAFLCFVGTLYAVTITIQSSPPVTVIVEPDVPSDYELTLNVDAGPHKISQPVVFYGTLTYLNDGSHPSGETVTLYYEGGSTTGKTGTTDVDGAYSIEWIPAINGIFVFYTEVKIP